MEGEGFFVPNLTHNCRLLVPGLELIYLWNGFSIIGRHYNLVESVYVAVQVPVLPTLVAFGS